MVMFFIKHKCSPIYKADVLVNYFKMKWEL